MWGSKLNVVYRYQSTVGQEIWKHFNTVNEARKYDGLSPVKYSLLSRFVHIFEMFPYFLTDSSNSTACTTYEHIIGHEELTSICT